MIPAHRVGSVPPPPTDRRRCCPRCGLVRQVNRGERAALCFSCRDTVTDLGELHLWRAT